MRITTTEGTYINYSEIKEKYNLTSHQVKLWINGEGLAKYQPLNYIQMDKRTILYNEDDIIKLIELKQAKKVYNDTLFNIEQSIQDWKNLNG